MAEPVHQTRIGIIEEEDLLMLLHLFSRKEGRRSKKSKLVSQVPWFRGNEWMLVHDSIGRKTRKAVVHHFESRRRRAQATRAEEGDSDWGARDSFAVPMGTSGSLLHTGKKETKDVGGGQIAVVRRDVRGTDGGKRESDCDTCTESRGVRGMKDAERSSSQSTCLLPISRTPDLGETRREGGAASEGEATATTILEKIVAKEIPVNIAYEDDNFMAFHNFNPQAPVHVLVIAKRRESVRLARLARSESDQAHLLGHLVVTASKVAHDLGLPQDGFRIVVNDVPPSGGPSVDHLHVHILSGLPLEWSPK